MESAEWKKIFLHTENYPDILLEDLKRNPEMLEFVEGYNDVHKKSSEGLTFEERKKKVPLFIQWDKRWGYEPYGTSDIGISGCGPTCMAMVIYSLTRNTEATPPVLAQKSMNEGYLSLIHIFFPMHLISVKVNTCSNPAGQKEKTKL